MILRSDARNIAKEDIAHCIPLNNNNLASIHGQRCLCGSYRIQHYTSRGPEGVLPTHMSGNRHTDLTTAWDSAVACKLAPSPLPHGPGGPLDNHPWMRELLWKSRFPTDEFQHIRGKKKKEKQACRTLILDRGRGRCWPYLQRPSCKTSHLTVKRDHFGLRYLLQGKDMSSQFLQPWGTLE